MELIRDLLRDLVGIIFPGGLFVIFTLWLIFCVVIVIFPVDLPAIASIGDSSLGFFLLLIFSYIAGQSIRIRQLEDLEKACTAFYRKRKMRKMTRLADEYNASIKSIDALEAEYANGMASKEQLAEMHKQLYQTFGFWEEFPYPYLIRGRLLYRQPQEICDFYEKYEQQGITKSSHFFNLLKTIIYEYSPSLKEELIRQEALVRLFAGIYYVLKFGTVAVIVTLLVHVITLTATYLGQFKPVVDTPTSWMIVFISTLALLAFWYLNREILSRLRYMRVKELNLAFDGFFTVCKKHNLSIG